MDTEEKSLYSAILIAIVAIATILAYFIASIFRQQRRYRELAQAKIAAEIITLENERRRVAADLHDEVGPLLSAIKLQITHLEPNTPTEHDLIDKSSRYIDETITKMREISNGLLPNLLVRKGLVPALDDFISKLQGLEHLKIDFQHKGAARISETTEVNLYRMVQEIVHNTVKHSAAKNLTLQIIFTPKMVRLSSEDDGRGFDYAEMIKAKSGLGLFTLHSRAEVMGGELLIDSRKGKGTRYLFEIPVA